MLLLLIHEESSSIYISEIASSSGIDINFSAI